MSPKQVDFRDAALWRPIGLRERLRWRNGAASAAAAVFYGFDRLPTAESMSGGMIKVLDLQTEFPNCPRGGNILYLISSALPRLAGLMARRARAAGVRVVLNQNGVAYPGWHGPGGERVNRSMRDVLQVADHVFYQSRFCRESADRFLGLRAGPSEILYNPVDTSIYVPAPTRSAEGSVVLLLAGSHHSFYRVQAAVDCLGRVRARLPQVRLLVAGRYVWRENEQAARAELDAYIAHQGLAGQVTVSGAYSPADTVALLQSAHILLHTKYNDPCPRLVVEAMACGLPVVYSATGGVPELVGPEAGLGVPGPCDYERDHPPDAARLAEAVAAVAADLPSFACAARARAVACFDTRPWLARHRAVFEALRQGSP